MADNFAIRRMVATLKGFGLVHRDHAAELIAEIEFFKTHPYAPVGLLSNF